MNLDLAGVHVLVTGTWTSRTDHEHSHLSLSKAQMVESGWKPLKSSLVCPYSICPSLCGLKRRHAEQGAKVTAQYRSSSVSLQPLTAEHPSALTLAQADLASESAVQSLFASLASPVEVLVVNHAVYTGQAPLKDMSLAQWSNTFDNNLTSSFLVVREYLKGLEKGVAAGEGRYGERAAVISVGSTAGTAPICCA